MEPSDHTKGTSIMVIWALIDTDFRISDKPSMELLLYSRDK